mgnify:FL=1
MSTSIFEVGTTHFVDFKISIEDQIAFSDLSGDTNPIHLDIAHARKHGFDKPIVYGGLMIAKLSQIVGMQFPGTLGMWTDVSMNFRRPLLIGERACISAEITQKSEATKTLVIAVVVRSEGEVIAKGRSLVTLFE